MVGVDIEVMGFFIDPIFLGTEPLVGLMLQVEVRDGISDSGDVIR